MDLKVFANNIEPSALQQIYALKEHPAFEGQKIRIMPDVHFGVGCVVGFTSTFGDKIVPAIIGVDIGCGVDAHFVGRLSTSLQECVLGDSLFSDFDEFVRKNVPAGFNDHPHDSTVKLPLEMYEFKTRVMETCARTGQVYSKVIRSLGTLGGGNHFIELAVDEQQDGLWLVIHSGSRGFGNHVAQYYQNLALKKNGPLSGREWLDGSDMNDYVEDMAIAQWYAQVNRQMMSAALGVFFPPRAYGDTFQPVLSVHNYINFKDKIIRKGAISAHVGERVIIPFNMRDGSIIAEGVGNEDWNCSAPHGAGRIMSRGQAKRSVAMDDFRSSMAGIWSSSISEETVDESPMVYKDKDEIMGLLEPTVKIIHYLKPVYNFKAQEKRRRRR